MHQDHSQRWMTFLKFLLELMMMWMFLTGASVLMTVWMVCICPEEAMFKRARPVLEDLAHQLIIYYAQGFQSKFKLFFKLLQKNLDT